MTVSQTNPRYIKFLEEYPKYSGPLTVLAKKLGVSRQRVHQFLKQGIADGIIKSAGVQKSCEVCTRKFRPIKTQKRCYACKNKGIMKRWCRRCAEIFLGKRDAKICGKCDKRRKHKVIPEPIPVVKAKPNRRKKVA